MGNPYLLLVILQLCVKLMECLTCESCQLTSCPVLTECKAGMVMDVCNCCAICAQSEGEKCGGKYELNGKCGLEFYCHQDDGDSHGICTSK